MVKFVGKMRSDKFKATDEAAPLSRPEPLPPALDEVRSQLVQGARLRCSRCRGFGHVADDCTVEEVAPVNERCFKCGEPGHLARQCSKKGSLNAFAPGRQEMREFKRRLREKAEEANVRAQAAKTSTRDHQHGKREPARRDRFTAGNKHFSTLEELDKELQKWNDRRPE